MKKLWLTLGTMCVVATPLITTISCKQEVEEIDQDKEDEKKLTQEVFKKHWEDIDTWYIVYELINGENVLHLWLISDNPTIKDIRYEYLSYVELWDIVDEIVKELE